jgi:flagellar export protein FliJ
VSGGRFKFSLQRLLTLREKAAHQAAIELAVARVAEEEAHDEQQRLGASRAEARDALMPKPGASRTVSELRHIAYLMEQLDARTEVADESVAEAGRAVHAKQASLGERLRDRRMLDRLRERHLADWRTADERRDRELMDGLGRSKHADTSRTPTSTDDQTP